MHAGDLIREKEFPEDAPALIVQVGDLRTKKPYKVWCPFWQGIMAFEKKYVQEVCEVASSASR